MSLEAYRTDYVSGRKLARARAIIRKHNPELYPEVLRAGDPGPGVFVSTIIDRAKMRGERPDDYEAALVTACGWAD